MLTNPGGHIDPKNVIGRDDLIELIWSVLEQQSVSMTAERRIGKTSVMKKMHAEPKDGWTLVLQDLEGIASCTDFTKVVYEAVKNHLPEKVHNKLRFREWLSKLGGTEIGGVIKLPTELEFPWQKLLTETIEDLINNQNDDNRLLFLWDEIPYMLENIRNVEGDAEAMKLLNTLRTLRQTHPEFRMLISGSIGLHHVLDGFKNSTHSNAATNDLATIDVPVLEVEDAKLLIGNLIDGEAISVADRDAVIEVVAKESDCFPYYIQHIIKSLKMCRKQDITEDVVRQIVLDNLINPNDPWDLKHFKNRIGDYYQESAQDAKKILDYLALQDDSVKARAIQKELGLDDFEQAKTLLDQLTRDHYLVRDVSGYKFRFPLIKRFWICEHELEDIAEAV